VKIFSPKKLSIQDSSKDALKKALIKINYIRSWLACWMRSRNRSDFFIAWDE
jgi:hypothetical protein